MITTVFKSMSGDENSKLVRSRRYASITRSPWRFRLVSRSEINARWLNFGITARHGTPRRSRTSSGFLRPWSKYWNIAASAIARRRPTNPPSAVLIDRFGEIGDVGTVANAATETVSRVSAWVALKLLKVNVSCERSAVFAPIAALSAVVFLPDALADTNCCCS